MEIVVIIIIVVIICIQIKKEKDYKKTTYYQVTQNSYSKTINSKGENGEYKIYTHLNEYENYGAKFLFNCYIPQQNNKTTEIDVIMIHPTGIFVFESKNYKGWIFGNEKNVNWTQTLSMGKGRPVQKNSFYNPIKQNQQHVHALRKIIGNAIPIYSIIVFSDDCTFKNVTITESTACVIQLRQLKGTIRAIIGCNSEYPDTYNVNEKD